VNETGTREEFASGMRYEEVSRKCYCCGRVIPEEPVWHEMLGSPRMFCSEDCIHVFTRYRMPYLDAD
jgi:hypothetical protein